MGETWKMAQEAIGERRSFDVQQQTLGSNFGSHDDDEMDELY